MKKSTLQIYIEWLDELRTLLVRHGHDTVEALQGVPIADLAEECHGIADGLRDIADELDELGNSLGHAEKTARDTAQVWKSRVEEAKQHELFEEAS